MNGPKPFKTKLVEEEFTLSLAEFDPEIAQSKGMKLNGKIIPLR